MTNNKYFNYTEIVYEFPTRDGLGAMMWKKIYAMSYALYYNKIFCNKKLEWFLIHESDKVIEESIEYFKILEQFNNLLYNPWANIKFDLIPNKTICQQIGLGTEETSGFTKQFEVNFLACAPAFNKFKNKKHNSIVIHVRRGNAIQENPRFIVDDFYVGVLKNIQSIIDATELNSPEIIICTDAPNSSIDYFPIGDKQKKFWIQNFLHKNETGGYPINTLDVEALTKVCPKLKIVNNLGTYESFIYMLTAEVLIVSSSAFSQSVGLLSNNLVIGVPLRTGMLNHYNYFRNSIGNINEQGLFVAKNPNFYDCEKLPPLPKYIAAEHFL